MAVPFPKCEGMQGEFYLTVDDKLHEHIAPLSDDLPLSVYTQSYRHAAREHIPLHWHSDVQLTWVYEGVLDYAVEGESLTLMPDDLLLVNAGRLHGSKTVQGDTRTLCINFVPELFPPALLRYYIHPLLENVSFSHAVLPLRAEWRGVLHDCCARESDPDCFAVYELLTQVLRELTHSFHGGMEESGEEAQLFQVALRYLHEHYSEPLPTKQLASAAAVNRTALGILFKKYTGMTPMQYRNEYRLYIAKSMIVGTDRPITDICAETGYNQLSHFIERFRLRYGTSPLQYRKRYGRSDRDAC